MRKVEREKKMVWSVVQTFLKMWKPFDWTRKLEGGDKEKKGNNPAQNTNTN